MVVITARIYIRGTCMHVHKMNSEVKAIQRLVKQNTGKIPCSLFAKGAMLFFLLYSVHKKLTK